MSTLAQLVTHRTEAGARYVAAITELRASFGDLAAIERLLANANAGNIAIQTFGGPQPDPIPLRHPVYAPNIGGRFEDDIEAAYATRSAVFGTTD